LCSSVGFSILIVRNDMTHSAIPAARNHFPDKDTDAELAVIHLSGHGLEVDEEN